MQVLTNTSEVTQVWGSMKGWQRNFQNCRKYLKNPSFLGVCGLEWRRVCMYVGWKYNRACTVEKIHENLRRWRFQVSRVWKQDHRKVYSDQVQKIYLHVQKVCLIYMCSWILLSHVCTHPIIFFSCICTHPIILLARVHIIN